MLPYISEDTISDKSKEDSMGKALAILQILWLIVQCLQRVIARLPVTPLEIHTVAHVVSALIIWALWWLKAQDVNDPTIISGEWTKSKGEVMEIFSNKSFSYTIDQTSDTLKVQRIYFSAQESDNFIFCEALTGSDLTKYGQLLVESSRSHSGTSNWEPILSPAKLYHPRSQYRPNILI